MKQRKILTTIALPYANGDLHLGHILEAIQADIWVRFQRMQGQECFYICASDAHGTPIMVKAREQGLEPEALVTKVRQGQIDDFAAFEISFDNFYTTHSPENQTLSNYIYQQLKARGDISTREISQAYDPVENMFLPDRYIKGECPCCHAKDQYGDSCEVCGKTYDSSELINPVSIISGKTPTTKQTEHFFFELAHYQDFLQTWVASGRLQAQVANKLQEWFEAGLRAWDITRDKPYFGFEIPDAPDKYFYVWLDAPVGYMASFKNFCDKHPQVSFDEFWGAQSQAELHHFIGKDITYFHSLFWPAMLHGSGFRTPTCIHVHGFLTVNGQKMSKSRGTFIRARDYLAHFSPTYLRYYFAAKLNQRVEDIDLNFADFTARINADLVGKVVNIASRCAGFINKKFNNQLADQLSQPALFTQFVAQGDIIAQAFEARDYNRAVRMIMDLADQANQYIDEQKPWTLAKDSAHDRDVQMICTMGLNLFKVLLTYLKPIVPALAYDSEQFLQCDAFTWANRQTPLLSTNITTFKPLLQRITQEDVDGLLGKGQ